MLKRKQVYLDPEHERRLKHLAWRTGTSEAEHIRRALEEYLSWQEPVDAQEEEDPLLEVIGLCQRSEGPRDASVNHDRYLYGRREGA